MLVGTPGVVQFSTVGSERSRGGIVMNGVYYVVSGTTLFSIDELGTVSNLGTVTGTVRVVMAHNGEKLCIVVPGGNGYVYNRTTAVFVQITDADYRTADTVCFKDGYYIFTATAGDVFFISALNDPLTFDPLDFGTAELSPDKIIGCHIDHDELFIFGSETTEVFQNVGGSGFPFQRIPGASSEKGLRSKYGLAQWESAFYFVGGGVNERTSIFRSSGTSEPIKISTNAVDFKIQEFTSQEIARAFTFTFSISGTSFVGFTFNSVNIPDRTFVFNVTASTLTGQHVWHEQQTGIQESGWRVASLDFVYDKLLVSDLMDGRVGYLDANVYTEYGETILREKVTGPFSADGRSIYVGALELTVDSGQGTSSGQGVDPLVMLDFSDDGARNFSSNTNRSMGKIGEYRRRVEWRRLGRVPAHRVWRLRVSDPVRVAFIKLEGRGTFGR